MVGKEEACIKNTLLYWLSMKDKPLPAFKSIYFAS